MAMTIQRASMLRDGSVSASLTRARRAQVANTGFLWLSESTRPLRQ